MNKRRYLQWLLYQVKRRPVGRLTCSDVVLLFWQLFCRSADAVHKTTTRGYRNVTEAPTELTRGGTLTSHLGNHSDAMT